MLKLAQNYFKNAKRGNKKNVNFKMRSVIIEIKLHKKFFKKTLFSSPFIRVMNII